MNSIVIYHPLIFIINLGIPFEIFFCSNLCGRLLYEPFWQMLKCLYLMSVHIGNMWWTCLLNGWLIESGMPKCIMYVCLSMSWYKNKCHVCYKDGHIERFKGVDKRIDISQVLFSVEMYTKLDDIMNVVVLGGVNGIILEICVLIQRGALIEVITLTVAYTFKTQKKFDDFKKENSKLKVIWNSYLPVFITLTVTFIVNVKQGKMRSEQRAISCIKVQ